MENVCVSDFLALFMPCLAKCNDFEMYRCYTNTEITINIKYDENADAIRQMIKAVLSAHGQNSDSFDFVRLTFSDGTVEITFR